MKKLIALISVIAVVLVLTIVAKAETTDTNISQTKCQWEKVVETMKNDRGSRLQIRDFSTSECTLETFNFPYVSYKDLKVGRIRMYLIGQAWSWPHEDINFTEWLMAEQRDIYMGKHLDNMTLLNYTFEGVVIPDNATGIIINVAEPTALLDGSSYIKFCYTYLNHSLIMTDVISIDVEYQIRPANC
jgi:hypothetical protein